jgi:hypothetical protein
MLESMPSRRRALRTLFVLSTSAMGVACAYDFGAVPDSGDNPPGDAGIEQGTEVDVVGDGVNGAMDMAVDGPNPSDVCSQGPLCMSSDVMTTTDACGSSTGCKTGKCCDGDVHDGPIDHEAPLDALDSCTGLSDGIYCGSELKGMVVAESLYECKGGVLILLQMCKYGCSTMSGMPMCIVPTD